jgi:hypothetical protein
MSDKDSAQNVIDSYRKRQQRTPFIVGGIAVALVVIGILLLALWMTGGISTGSLFATDTPTPTETSTSTLTPTITTTPTPTETLAPTNTLEPTATETPSGPFVYIVQELDTCFSIAEQFEVDLLFLIQMNNLTDACIIRVGRRAAHPAARLEHPHAHGPARKHGSWHAHPIHCAARRLAGRDRHLVQLYC